MKRGNIVKVEELKKILELHKSDEIIEYNFINEFKVMAKSPMGGKRKSILGNGSYCKRMDERNLMGFEQEKRTSEGIKTNSKGKNKEK